MALERIYTVNLRKDFIKVGRWRRVPRAVRYLREFVKRHMKVEEVKIDTKLNEYLWVRSRQKPPAKLRIKIVKDGNVATVELFETLSEETSKVVEEATKDEGKKE